VRGGEHGSGPITRSAGALTDGYARKAGTSQSPGPHFYGSVPDDGRRFVSLPGAWANGAVGGTAERAGVVGGVGDGVDKGVDDGVDSGTSGGGY
jgi:hypothetical protein